MDQESFIIDLLSAGEAIYKRVRKNRQKNMISALLFLIGACVLFFGVGSFVYQRLALRVHSIDSGYWLRGSYHFSLVLGILSVTVVGLFFLVNILQGILLRRSFQRFLERHVRKALKYPIVYQDREAYYLAEEAQKPAFRLVKSECLELTTTFDGATIYLGDRQEFWGVTSIQLFVLNDEAPLLPVAFPKTQGVNRKWSLLMISLVFLAERGFLLMMG